MFRSYNDRYEVSLEGSVRNSKTGRILKPFKCGRYLGVWLGAGNKRYIHHLVAETFLVPPTEEGCVIDHINRNVVDNNASNLRWLSRSGNSTNRTLEEKARPTSKTGEHHITLDAWGGFIVRIVIAKKLHYKYFGTIEEAKHFRDTLIEEHRDARRDV